MSSRVRLVVVMDPIEAIKPAKDSTLAILLAAQARGWQLFYAEQKDLWLREGIATTAKDICSELSHDSGALTRVIDQLAERGLVERSRDSGDRRKVELRLTDSGRQSIEAVIPAVVDIMNWSISDFTREESTELVRLLTKFNASMEAKLGVSSSSSDVKV